MPLTPALIQFDNGQALREGWDLFETSPIGEPLMIQRNDESSSFEDDAEALAFVFNSAFDGSDYHKTALALHLGLYTLTEATNLSRFDGYGLKLVSRESFLHDTFDGLPEDVHLGLRVRVRQYPGAFVVYDPDDDADGWLLVGDVAAALVADSVARFDEDRA